MRNDILKKFFEKENKSDATKPTFDNHLFLDKKKKHLVYPQITLQNVISKGIHTKVTPKDYLCSGFKRKEDVVIKRVATKKSSQHIYISKKSIDTNTISEHPISFNMIYCDVGNFVMGSDNKEHKNPKKNMEIKQGFWLGEVEVTIGLFFDVLPNEFVDCCSKTDINKPIHGMIMNAIFRFCNKLSRSQGLNACYWMAEDQVSWYFDPKQNGYRLPFAFEWEYAAKASTTNRWSGTNDASNLYEYAVLSNQNTLDVATKLPNEWGFYDMTGNVWEVCLDENCLDGKNIIVQQADSFCVFGGSYYTENHSKQWNLGLNMVDSTNKYKDDDLFGKYLNNKKQGVGFRIARTHY